MKKKIFIKGMTCEHCSRRVQKALGEMKEVENVAVSLEDKTAVVSLSEKVEKEKLVRAIEEVGYEVVGME